MNTQAISGNTTGSNTSGGIGVVPDATFTTVTANLNNDVPQYDEGTWTPVCHRESGGAITAVYAAQTGRYVKNGNFVTVIGLIDITSVSAQGTGANEVKGLPYAPTENSVGAGSVARNTPFTTDVVTRCWAWSDGRLIFSSDVNSNDATAVDWKAGFMNFAMTYYVG